MSERRRMMMGVGDYISYLKEMGCITYFPLDNGDLQNKITGLNITLSGQGSMVWDSSKSMYKITTSSDTYNTYVASFTTPAISNKNTIFCKICIAETNPNNQMFTPIGCTPTANYHNLFLLNNKCQVWTRFYPTTPTVVANMRDTSSSPYSLKIYYGNSLKYSTNSSTSSFLTDMVGDTSIVLGWIGQYEYDSYATKLNLVFWIKDLYIFNRILTIDEVNEVLSKK